jgi:hypothetical protein
LEPGEGIKVQTDTPLIKMTEKYRM